MPEDLIKFGLIPELVGRMPVMTALASQAPSPDPLNIRWGHSALEVLSLGEEFSRCRHLETGRELDRADYEKLIAAALGLTHFIECGPGKVLSGMAKRIDKTLVVAPVSEWAEVEAQPKIG